MRIIMIMKVVLSITVIILMTINNIIGPIYNIYNLVIISIIN